MSNTMILLAHSSTPKTVAGELVARLSVDSDTAELNRLREHWRRKVTGRILERGPLWDEFMSLWVDGVKPFFQEDGHDYFTVNQLQVDHDYYAPNFSWLSLEGDTIRLLLLESFRGGDVNEYYEQVRERNAEIQHRRDCIDREPLTRNDAREALGKPRLAEPHYEQPLSPSEADEVRKTVKSHPDFQLLRNIVS